MPQPAYQLERFAPRPAVERKMAVTPRKKRRLNERARQLLRMVRTLAAVLLVLGLVVCVLHTQARLIEIQSDIAAAKSELNEKEAEYHYLTFEMESQTNMRYVEQRARELGLERVNKGQIVYVRVQDGDEIEVSPNFLEGLISGARTGLLSIFDGED